MFDDLTEEEKELFEERAAIMEYDGGMTREQAEKEAYKDVVKKNCNKPVLLGNNKPKDNFDPFQDI